MNANRMKSDRKRWRQQSLVWCHYSFLALGLLALGYCAKSLMQAWLYQRWAHQQMQQQRLESGPSHLSSVADRQNSSVRAHFPTVAVASVDGPNADRAMPASTTLHNIPEPGGPEPGKSSDTKPGSVVSSACGRFSCGL